MKLNYLECFILNNYKRYKNNQYTCSINKTHFKLNKKLTKSNQHTNQI